MSNVQVENHTTRLVVNECPVCGVAHAIPASMDERALEHPQSHPRTLWIYCPNGHKWSYTGETEATKLKRQLDRERDRAARLTSALDQTEASRRAQKAATTRARKRHAAGVCPSCKRSFQNVKRHMESQHPDFDPAGS